MCIWGAASELACASSSGGWPTCSFTSNPVRGSKGRPAMPHSRRAATRRVKHKQRASSSASWTLTSSFRTGMLTPTRRRTTMKFGRRNRWTTAAFALVLAIGVASTAGAQQAPGRCAGARAVGRLRPAHRVGVVALTRTPVHPTHPQREPRTCGPCSSTGCGTRAC